MKWHFFKRSEARPARFADNRRLTGVMTGLPKGLETLLTGLFVLGCLFGGGWGGWKLFENYYFRSQNLFVLHDLSRNVSITTGKTLTPDLICEVLGIREGINLFSLPIEERRKELLEQAPNIRDITIVRRMPDKLVITIVEREPIARVGSNGRVVDEEGVVFVRYAGTGGLPVIKGSDEFLQVKPGDRLHGMNMAAVHLVNSALRPECRVRILVVDTAKDDYLFLTLSDHRQAKIAWDGMQDEEKNTEVRMQRQFDQLSKAMDSEIGRPCQLWNAMHPGRIFAAPPTGDQ
jgi:hypothetical protein